jgi:hypothetical protein
MTKNSSAQEKKITFIHTKQAWCERTLHRATPHNNPHTVRYAHKKKNRYTTDRLHPETKGMQSQG